MKKLILAGLIALVTIPAQAALFGTARSNHVAVAGQKYSRGYTESRTATPGSGGLAAMIGGGTNSIATNVMFEIPFAPATGGAAPVTFQPTFIGAISTTNNNLAFIFDVSVTSTNAADFTTTGPLVAHFCATNAGVVRFSTNFTSTALGAARFIRLTSVSNACGTASVSYYLSNVVFGAFAPLRSDGSTVD